MKGISLILALLFILSLAVVSQADIVIKKKMAFEGMMGMGNHESIVTEYIRPDRDYTEEARLAGKQKEEIHITRLDKGVLWNIDPDKQTYTEMPLSSLKEMMAEAKESGNQPESSPEDNKDNKYEWTVEIKSPEGLRELNGFRCKNIVGKATGINKEDPTDKIFVTYEFWLGQNVANLDELNQYYRNYAKALGINEDITQQDMGQMTKEYSRHFEDFYAKVKEAGGYPIKTSIMIEKAGNMNLGGDAGDEEGQKKAAAAMAKMGGLFGKKSAAKSPDGMTVLMSMTTEIVSLESKNIEDAKFEIPAGYKKK